MRRNFSLHENYRDDEQTEAGSDRAFGYTVGAVLMVIGAAKSLIAGTITLVSFLIFVPGSILLLLSAVAPSRLSALNKFWLKIGAAIAKVINPIVLAFLFFSCGHPNGLSYAGSRETTIAPCARSGHSKLLDRA